MALCFAIGLGGTIQAGTNYSLSRRLNALPLVASLLSFLGGTLLLAATVAVLNKRRKQRLAEAAGARRAEEEAAAYYAPAPFVPSETGRDGVKPINFHEHYAPTTALADAEELEQAEAAEQLQPWELVGGALGASAVLTAVVVAPALGYQVYTLSKVAGELLGAVAVDAVGLLGLQRRAPTALRAGGALLTLLGCLLTLADRGQGAGGSEDSSGGGGEEEFAWWRVALALFTGCLLPIQASINRRLSERLPAGVKTGAALISFSVGSCCLAASALLGWALSDDESLGADTFSSLGEIFSALGNWWMLLGGLYGSFFVAGGVLLTPRLGATAYFVSSVCGAIVSAIAADHFGILGFAVRGVTWLRFLGAAVAVAGVGCVARSNMPESTLEDVDVELPPVGSRP